MASTLAALKAKSAAKVLEEKRGLDRRRELLVLTLQFLQDQGFVGAAEQLTHEAGLTLSKHQVADNVELPLVFQHFLEYYEMRFGRQPKVLRKMSLEESVAASKLKGKGGPGGLGAPGGGSGPAAAARRVASRAEDSSTPTPETGKGVLARRGTKESKYDGGAADEGEDAGVGGFRVDGRAVHNQGGEEEEARTDPSARLLKPLSMFLDGTSGDTKDLAMLISRDIFTENPNVRWDDVVGQDDAKRLLKEAMVMPLKYPQLFQDGLVSPWKGVLLYGPPGTGKTMLAKAVATECSTTFFNISASSIVSRYRGDSEKLVRILFDLARYHAPSTIFLDEIDSIMGQRGGGGGSGTEHEASRRMKTELLIQMDGLAKCKEADDPSRSVFVMAASNLPWELDAALLRRLEKRVFVQLPDEAGRRDVFLKNLPDNDPRTDGIDYQELAANTDGYSCADVCLVCKEAAMYPVRRLMSDLEAFEDLSRQAGNRGKQRPANDTAMGPVTQADALSALKATRPSAVSGTMDTFLKWQADFGCA